MLDDDHAIYYEDENTRGETQQDWWWLHIPANYTLWWMDLIDLSITPQISSLSLSLSLSLPLSIPKGGEQAPTGKGRSCSPFRMVSHLAKVS
jgi:hypothetical protein